MAQIPTEALLLKTESKIENQLITQQQRPYLGISNIANSCARSIWYSFRWVSEIAITPRVNRLFQRGHREEDIIIADLEAIGIKVYSRQEEAVAGQGHIKGHHDGRCINVPDAPKTEHLLELKTANDSNFKKVKKEGCKKAKPLHYGQCQCYMKYFKLKRTLYIMVNKNDDQRHYERFNYVPAEAKQLERRAMDIISTETPPKRIGNQTWYECRFCDHRAVCHDDLRPKLNCRTCKMADIHPAGEWKCSRVDLFFSTEQQRMGCGKYKIMEGLKNGS